ncbi:hypothetical protein [Streptomyces sp. NPDC048611]|uniref:hypothetical protein n=1 Tax=Streptomyces sp. NPDC048611 TaxID=3155635 RepID=UPI00343806BB
MAFTASGVFKQFLLDPVFAGTSTSATGYGANGIGASGDTVKVALFNNSVTPDKDAAVASTGFNTGTWTTGNEVVDATNWVSGGRTLSGNTLSSVTNAVMFDATDLAGGGAVTLSNVYGCFVYDDSVSGGTVADQGVCFNYFGGAQSVTGGTFTIVWHANGIFRVTV